MRITQLQGQRVVDRATALTLGKVIDVFVDATGARIVALEVGAQAGGRGLRIPAEWIACVGSCAVMVARRSSRELAEVIPATEHCLNCQSVVGLEVLDERGERVGHLQDAGVEEESLAITRFELLRTGWRGWLNLRSELHPNEVACCSRDVMLIRGRRVASDRDPVA